MSNKYDKIRGERDKKFNEDPNLPWSGIRNALRLGRPSSYNISIHGYFLVDKRQNPNMAIFKNYEISMSKDVKQTYSEPPKPFEYLGQAVEHKKKMHLSSKDEKFVVITALSPDPGYGVPKPNKILFTKDDAKDR